MGHQNLTTAAGPGEQANATAADRAAQGVFGPKLPMLSSQQHNSAKQSTMNHDLSEWLEFCWTLRP